MCGRFNVEADPLSRLLMGLVGLPHPGPDNHNAAPTETLTVLRRAADGTPELVPMRWWLTPHWATDVDTRYSMFNARTETVDQSRAFREPFRKRRCVVPVSGFYEWAQPPADSAEVAPAGPPRKMPCYLQASDVSGLLIAGIWDHWRPPAPDAPELLSFAILTTAASARLSFVHHRQPVMLSSNDAERWLDGSVPVGALAPLLAPRVPVPLTVVPVSTWVNNARHKDRRCLERVGPVVQVAVDDDTTLCATGAAAP
jgi:putative SOS response-associated peptidase YedK